MHTYVRTHKFEDTDETHICSQNLFSIENAFGDVDVDVGVDDCIHVHIDVDASIVVDIDVDVVEVGVDVDVRESLGKHRVTY